MQIAKLAALLAIVGLAALPVASCGPISFKGYQLLLNKQPDAPDISKTFGSTTGEAGGNGDSSLKITPSPKANQDDPLFQNEHRWLHFLYIGVAVMAALGLVVPARSRAVALVGLLGGGGFVFFMNRFNAALMQDAKTGGMQLASLSWEVGAYLAVAGFAVMFLAGVGVRVDAPGGAITRSPSSP
jgi:hypothetical protein